MSTDPDADLVAAAQRGDRRALDDLLRRHQPRLFAVCRRLTGSDADADDSTQEALVAIVRALPGFDSRSRFGTWAYRIAVNA
ncbi:MAG: sigma-70 family RNA polymerase sigma factor, partial [Acidimicrobiales bacterium]